MGAFLLGLIIGIAAAIFLFIYDEGEQFIKLANAVLRLANRVKLASTRFKQQRAG